MPDTDAIENVLFLFTDQQRADSLGAYGGDARTPALDGLAASGTVFEQAFTPTAICTPARTALVTGQRPSSTGVTANVGKSWTTQPESVTEEPCYPRALREAGYAVDLLGKSHFGVDPGEFGFDGPYFPGHIHPMDHEDYVAYLDERDLPQFDETALESRIPEPGVGRLDACVDPRPPEASFTHFLADRTIERLEAHAAAEQPFYLGTHFFGPHRPYYIPRAYFDMYDPEDVSLPESAAKETFLDKPGVHEEQYYYWQLDRVDVADWRKLIAVYRGYVTFIDEQIGRVLQALEDLGLRERTAIAFSSDHGAFVTRHKLQDKGPAMYDDIYQIPLILDLPGAETAVDRQDHLVSLLDLSPTVLELCDVAVPDSFEGRSLLGVLDATAVPDWRDDVLFEFNGLQYAYSQRALRTERYKLVVNPPDGDELYDLDTDPNELTNRIADPAYADVRSRLYSRLASRLRDSDDDFCARRPGHFPGRHPDRRPDFE